VKRFAPRAETTKGPLLARLREVLPRRGLVLEIASGTGQHVAHFAAALPDLHWQPSERSVLAIDSITSWTTGMTNVHPPIDLDGGSAPWPIDAADAVIVIDLLHLVPASTMRALLAEASRILPRSGPLCIYGAFRTAATAAPAPRVAHLAGWTVSIDPPTTDAVCEVAAAHRLELVERHEMAEPDRQLLVFRRM